MFEETYEGMPRYLEDQRQELKDHFRKYPDEYDLHNFVDGESWPYK